MLPIQILEGNVQWILLIIFLAGFFIIVTLLKLSNNKSNDIQKELGGNFKTRSLVTENELRFYNVLGQALKDTQFCICPKVRMLDLFKIVNADGSYNSVKNMLIQKHIDFVIVNRSALIPYCAIELDDRTHNYTLRKQSDELKDKVFADAGLRLIRIQSKQSYDVEYLRKIIVI